ncbi:MAG: ECF transporter S component [Smithellaceae bacterium]
MQNHTMTLTGVKSFRRVVVAFGLLVFLPCLLSLINVTFAQSWKIHFFPAAIILAAISFGPAGGLVAGITGSLYSAILFGNPYLIVGNALMGFLTGVFFRKTSKIIPSVILAFVCQLPWLILSDYYFAGLSSMFIARLVVVLFLGNLFWALLISLGMKPIKKYLC